MPFSFNSRTNEIKMAAGDTATIMIEINWEKLSAGDVILFAVFDPNMSGDMLCKAVEIVSGKASVRLCNHDTRDIEPGNYNWNLRVVTSPARDENGNVCVDECTDEVVTVFDNPPKFKLTNGGAYV